MNHVMTLLFDKDFLITIFVGIMAFATVVTLGVPYLERGGLDDRLKSVARRREELPQYRRPISQPSSFSATFDGIALREGLNLQRGQRTRQ